MGQGFSNAQIRVVQLHIFAYKPDGDAFRHGHGRVDHGDPVAQVGAGRVQPKAFADDIVQTLVLQRKRDLIQKRKIQVLDHAVFIDVAEKRDLLFNIVADRPFGTENNNVRLNADGEEFLDAVLGRLRLMFMGTDQIRNQGNMDKQAVVSADLRRKLTDGLQKRLALNIADRAAHFNDRYVNIVLPVIDTGFDFVGNMGDHLNRTPIVIAVALVLQDIPVNSARSNIAVLGQALVDKAFVMAKIQIRFRSVIGYENLSVLKRVHGARINIQIGVEFQSPCLQ